MINKQSYQIQGMRQDNLVATGASSKFAHEIMNMRLNTIGDYTTGIWTTEKGTKEVVVYKFKNYDWFTDKIYEEDGKTLAYSITDFKPIGQAVINNYWVLFGIVDETISVIIRLHYAETNKISRLYGRILYWGDLNFSASYPIETLTFYENESIQKVYWTDGYNQPRVINIMGAEDLLSGFPSDNNTQFDFVQEVNLNENVTIDKIQASNGLFPPCTVKYALTYYKKYGQETNIVYDSPLYYPTLGDRGCSPDELSGDVFKITVSDLDLNHGFDYIRLYSIIRTTDNATPVVRIVEDKYIKDLTANDSVEFIDSNTKGEIVDPTILNYVGGINLLAETINQKDNVLFLGGITLKDSTVTELLNKKVPGSTTTYNDMLTNSTPAFIYDNSKKNIYFPVSENTKYTYDSQLKDKEFILPLSGGGSVSYKHRGNSFYIKQFKKGEYYRIGIQFQNKYGVWSEVIRLIDLECDKFPKLRDLGGTSGDVRYWENMWVLPILRYTLPTVVAEYLYGNGYRKARLMCCYTNNSDRTFIAQGIINQTVYNHKEATSSSEGVPYTTADWFFRPFNNSNDIGPTTPFTSYKITNQEIQSIKDSGDDNNPDDSQYFTRPDYWTLNSPDVELDESIRTLPTANWQLQVINGLNKAGGVTFSAIYLDATKGAMASNGSYGTGLQGNTSVQTNLSHVFTFAKWNDANIYYEKDGSGIVYYPLMPFHRETSLNNYVKDYKWWYDGLNSEVNLRQHAKINSKVFSTLGFITYNSVFNLSQVKWGSDFQFFDSNEVTPLIVNSKVYYGNQNTIAYVSGTNVTTSPVKIHGDQYQITFNGNYRLPRYNGNTLTYQYSMGDGEAPITVWCADPVSITYKSIPHIVFYGTPDINCFPVRIIQGFPTFYNYYVADIYRDVNENIRFGGVNNKNNIYIPCGPAISLKQLHNYILDGYEGDHYFMRYDCLKTYPYTNEDTNQIVEILSFPCFSRINLDGRYDRNRGKIDNTLMSPTNFNLINNSYTQNNNFFSYTELGDDVVASEVTSFPNQITWTDTKISGEEVDNWTNLTLASTFDADGTAGKITKIINYEGKALLLFQEHGIAQINYNENTALSTESGLPLELAKTGKFTGLNYITRDYGCQNKWSISQTKNGIMWIDDSRQEILRYGEGIQPLSSMNGFDAFMIQQLPKDFVVWNPSDFDNFVTYYDKLSNDVYFVNKDYCLAWNEISNSFTSFYSYENTSYMTNLGSYSLIWHNGLWAVRAGDNYSNFFGEDKDYWITLVCDGQTSDGNAFPADKVFNNIEFRADIYNMEEPRGIYNTIPFNTKAAWNGYQFYKEFNDDSIRKFNTWRIQLPRATYKDSRGILYTNRDRIRNPFCYITLKQNQTKQSQTNRVMLYDLAVYFDMK